MKSLKFELFYSPMCSICPKAKDIIRAIVEEFGIESYEEINFHSKTTFLLLRMSQEV